MREAERRALAKGFGLFAGAFVFLLVVVAVSAQFGLGDAIVGFVVVAFTLVTYAAIGVGARTLSIGEFLLSGRSVPAGFNGLATAVALLSAAAIVGLVAAFFADEALGVAIVAGWSLGFVLLATLVAPYYRKSGAVTVPDYLAVRFGNPLIRLFAVAALLVAIFPLAPASIGLAAAVTAEALRVGPDAALAVVVGVLALSALLGGMRAITLVAGAQAIVVLAGVVAPPVLLSMQEFGLPVAQFTYGFAVEAVVHRGGETVSALAGSVFPVEASGWPGLVAVAVSVAAGVAAMPQIVQRSGVTPGMADARRSAAWALVVASAVLLTAPAIAAFGRAAIVDGVAGVDFDALPAWLFEEGRRGAVVACGAPADSAAAIGAACGAAKVIEGLAPADLAVSGDAVALAFGEIAGLPYVMTALILAAILAAALAAAGATLLAVTATLGHDVYARMLDRRAPTGRRLIVSRLCLLGALAVAASLATSERELMFRLAALAPSLAAAAFFPAMVLGAFWSRTTWIGALAGMAAGLAAAIAWAAGAAEGGALAAIGVPAAGSGAVGIVLGFAVVVVVSILTPSPSEARREVAAAIRRPSHDPILEDHAV